MWRVVIRAHGSGVRAYDFVLKVVGLQLWGSPMNMEYVGKWSGLDLREFCGSHRVLIFAQGTAKTGMHEAVR